MFSLVFNKKEAAQQPVFLSWEEDMQHSLQRSTHNLMLSVMKPQRVVAILARVGREASHFIALY